MFKLSEIMSGPGKWTSVLIKEDRDNKDNRIGFIGVDNEVLFINLHSNKTITVAETMLLISQLIQNNPDLLQKKIEISEQTIF